MNKKKNNYKKILLDTNFLLIPYQFRVDIFTQIDKIIHFPYKIFVLDKGIEELKKIVGEQKGKSRDAAKIALKLIAIKNIAIVNTEGDKKADDAIIELSSKSNYVVATQDKDLKRRLINYGTTVIILRQKKILALVNDKGF
ncbi:nucleotide-binding protein [Candidatus Woesearchaeota archaeon]|nr:nucleotide-binding protein [Candidatus Woesearchaeota archaeon]